MNQPYGATIALAGSMAFSFALSDVIAGAAGRRASAVAVAMWSHIAALGPAAAIVAVARPAFTWSDCVDGSIAGLLLGLGDIAFIVALASGTMGSVACVAAVLSAGIPAIAGIAYGEHMNAVKDIGLALGFAALLIPSGQQTTTPDRRIMLLAALAGAAFGFANVLLGRTDDVHGLAAAMLQRVTAVAVLAFIVAAMRRPAVARGKPLGLALASGVVNMAGSLIFATASHTGGLATAAVGGISLVIPATILIAAIAFRERLTRPQWVSATLATLGVGAVSAP